MKKFCLAALMMVATMCAFAQDMKMRSFEDDFMDWEYENLDIKGEYVDGNERLYIIDDSNYIIEYYDRRNILTKTVNGTYTKGDEPNTYIFDFDPYGRPLTLRPGGLYYNNYSIYFKLR